MEIEQILIEDEADETDELLEQLRTSQSFNATEFNDLKQRITECQTRMEVLSTRQTPSENPMLVQIQKQLTDQALELEGMRASMDSLASRPIPNPLPQLEENHVPETETVLSENFEVPAETAPEPVPIHKKNRFL